MRTYSHILINPVAIFVNLATFTKLHLDHKNGSITDPKYGHAELLQRFSNLAKHSFFTDQSVPLSAFSLFPAYVPTPRPEKKDDGQNLEHTFFISHPPPCSDDEVDRYVGSDDQETQFIA